MTLKVRKPSAKLAHIEACLTEAVLYQKTTGLEKYDLVNQAASDVALNKIDLSTTFMGKVLGAPLMIASMTGGVERGLWLNQRWAEAAEFFKLPMGVGSQRLGLENPAQAPYYQIRQHAPNAFIFANLGAAQFCKGWGALEALRAVEMIKADALFIHLNAMQEVCQDGDVDFSNLTKKIAEVCAELSKAGVPVFAREVCFGMSVDAVKRLIDAGVSGIDCAGAGGTSWAKVEAVCSQNEKIKKVGNCFGEWGIPTATSIMNVRSVNKEIPLIATGGLTTGLDLAKALVLGADIGAMARPMLLAACTSEAALFTFIEQVLLELRVSMFGVGAINITELKKQKLILHSSD